MKILNNKVTFTIEGEDLKKLKEFEESHKDCHHSVEGGKFEYTFVPTTLGMAIIVKCNCGKELLCGDFLL